MGIWCRVTTVLCQGPADGIPCAYMVLSYYCTVPGSGRWHSLCIYGAGLLLYCARVRQMAFLVHIWCWVTTVLCQGPADGIPCAYMVLGYYCTVPGSGRRHSLCIYGAGLLLY